MPERPLKPCAVRSCSRLTRDRYCERHAREHWRQINDQFKRAGTAARGYDAHWQRLRRMYLAQHPLCEDCLSRGQTVAGELVHHVLPIDEYPDRRLEWDNLRTLCRSCHERAHGLG